jgi:hypothetical protein
MDADGFRLDRMNTAGMPDGISGAIQSLADANYPLTRERARNREAAALRSRGTFI